MFAHVLVFLSFVYAIAITHPLTSVTELIQARDRVRWSGLLLCWMAAGVLLLTINWLVLFRLAALEQWTTAQVLVRFPAAMLLYFTCSLSAIRPEAGKPVDMPAFFERNRVPIQLAFVLFGVAGIAINLLDMATVGLSHEAARGRIVNGAINMTAIGVALVVRARWVQWAVVLFLLARYVYIMFGMAVAG